MSDGARWYVVHTYSGYENKVAATIQKTVENRGLQELIFDVRVPMETVTEVRDTGSKEVERKLFPGYVLVKMIMNDETWHLVKNTARITGFLGGSANKPSPLPAKDIEAIKSKMEAGSEAPRPRVEFEVGGSVRIKNGPFTDFNGIIEEVNYDKNRLRVMVSIFGRDTPVELAFNEVEKA